MKITGHAKPIERLLTGLYSFDRAFINKKGEIGYPLGKMAEVWGATHVGKSTVVHSLSAMIAKELDGDVVLTDLEDFDPELLKDIYMAQGFDGELHSELTEKDETNLELLLDKLHENYCVGILDSVGAISPLGERSGNLGARYMGQRAFLMAQFCRRGIYVLRSSEAPKCIFMINHQHPAMGGFSKGYKPPGGETKGYLSSIRIALGRWYVNKKEQRFSDGSYIIKGVVKKNKWGLQGLEFYLFVLAGKGIHVGLTALVDSVVSKRASRKNGIIKIGDKKYGRLSKIIERAHDGDEEFFQPFLDALSTNDEDIGENENESV